VTPEGGIRSGPSALLVVGADGGSGASLIAGGLALAWARAGESVWLLEVDVDRADRADAWGLAGARSLADLGGVMTELDARHVGHAALQGPSGLRLLGAPPTPGMADAWDAPALRRLAGATGVAAGSSGRVVIDAGPGLGRPARALSADVGTLLIVCGPRVAAARRARRIVEAHSATGGGAVCALALARGPGAGEMGARAIARAVGASVAGEIPWSPGEAALLGAGSWPQGRRSRLARAVEALAEAVG
jgi:MinD-like ATPase involved in chromosome partitioning or flagellar assembly